MTYRSLRGHTVPQSRCVEALLKGCVRRTCVVRSAAVRVGARPNVGVTFSSSRQYDVRDEMQGIQAVFRVTA